MTDTRLLNAETLTAIRDSEQASGVVKSLLLHIEALEGENKELREALERFHISSESVKSGLREVKAKLLRKFDSADDPR